MQFEHYLNPTLHTPYDQWYLEYAMYHFILDTFLNASLRNSSGYLIVAHHGFLLSLYQYVTTHPEYMGFVYMVHMGEISSFFNVLSEIIKTHWGEVRSYFYTKIPFVFTFVFLRSHLLGNVWTFYLTHPEGNLFYFHPLLSIGLIGLTILHAHWYRLLFRKITKMIFTKTE